MTTCNSNSAHQSADHSYSWGLAVQKPGSVGDRMETVPEPRCGLHPCHRSSGSTQQAHHVEWPSVAALLQASGFPLGCFLPSLRHHDGARSRVRAAGGGQDRCTK